MTDSNFVYGNVALPANKLDSGGGSAVATNPTRRWSPNDANRVFLALTDTRTAIGDIRANARSYGAVGDGATDDTAAIQAAINAAEGTSSIAYVPTGVHMISDTLFIPDKVVLSGIGRGDVGKIKASATFPTDGRPMIRLGRATDTIVFGSRVERLIIDGNSRAGKIVYSTIANEQCGVRFCVLSNFTTYGVHFTNDGVNFSSGVFVEDTEVYPPAAGATTGIYFEGVALDNLVKRVTIGVSGLLTKGLHVKSTQCLVVGLHIENCTIGVNLDTNSSSVLIGVNGGLIANIPDLIVDQGNNHHIGINLQKNSATNLIRSLFGGYTITDGFMPLWVGGDSILGGAAHLPLEIVPAQITSNQNDYNPGGFYTSAQTIRISTDAARDITGLLAGNKGRLLWLINAGSFNATLKHQNAGSAATNRFIGRANADVVLLPGTAVQVHYSPSQLRWQVLNAP
jgi:hypothetical protein